MTSAAMSMMDTVDLGQVLAVYKVREAKNRSNQLFGWLFIITGPLLVLLSLIWTFTSDSGGLNILCGGIGLLLALGGAFALWEQKRDKSIRVGIYQNGLAYFHNGKTESFRWDDIASFQVNVVDVRMRNSRTVYDTVHGYTITPKIGPVVKFSLNKNSVPNVDQLSNTIQQEVARRQGAGG